MEIKQKNLPLWAVHGLMLFSSVLVSSSFTVGKAITSGLDPVVLILVRFVLAALFFVPLLARSSGFIMPSFGQLRGYAAVSFTTVVFFWCMFESLRYTTALNTSVIFTLTPGISGVYSAFFLKERLGKGKLLALLYGAVGAIWVIFQGDFGRMLSMEVNRGDVLFLAGCFLMAGYTPLVKRVHRQESMTFMTFWVFATGIGWLLLPAIQKLGMIDWRAVPMTVWAGVVYLGIFSTVVTFYLTHLATVYLGPTRVMAYSYFYPLFVLLIDWGFGHGLPPLTILPGVVVVTLAMVVVQRGAVENV